MLKTRVLYTVKHRLPRLSSEFYLFGVSVTPMFINIVLNNINNATAPVVPSNQGLLSSSRMVDVSEIL